MDLAFYTYFYGSNKNTAFSIPELPSSKYNCYYFTNNERMMHYLKETKWIAVYDDKPTTDDMIQSNMVGKHIKTMPHEYAVLRKYAYLCYLDSKVEKVNDLFVESHITKYFIDQNYALLLREHEFVAPCVWNEYVESIMHQQRYRMEGQRYLDYIRGQLTTSGLSQITKQHAQCGFLIRNMRHPKTNEISTTWYRHIQECGIQDQISFFFVKQLFADDECILMFPEYPYIWRPIETGSQKTVII